MMITVRKRLSSSVLQERQADSPGMIDCLAFRFTRRRFSLAESSWSCTSGSRRHALCRKASPASVTRAMSVPVYTHQPRRSGEDQGTIVRARSGQSLGKKRGMCDMMGGTVVNLAWICYSHGASLRKQDFLAWRSFLALLWARFGRFLMFLEGNQCFWPCIGLNDPFSLSLKAAVLGPISMSTTFSTETIFYEAFVTRKKPHKNLIHADLGDHRVFIKIIYLIYRLSGLHIFCCH